MAFFQINVRNPGNDRIENIIVRAESASTVTGYYRSRGLTYDTAVECPGWLMNSIRFYDRFCKKPILEIGEAQS